MNKEFRFQETEMEGLYLIEPKQFPDERGLFMKTYERSVFEAAGIRMSNGEDLTSISKKGVMRGLHFQYKNPQDKLVNVLLGEVYDVVLDLRKDSKTFGQWKGIYLSDKNRISMYIPSGFAHGFLALGETNIFSYRCSQSYEREFDSGIIWNDEQLDISWPLDKIDNLIISEKDKSLQRYSNFLETIGSM